MPQKLRVLVIAASLLLSGPVYSDTIVTRQFGGACGKEGTTEYVCGNGLSCTSGTCGMTSYLNDTDRKCKSQMQAKGYDQKNASNHPMIWGGFCYVSKDVPGMSNAVVNAQEAKNRADLKVNFAYDGNGNPSEAGKLSSDSINATNEAAYRDRMQEAVDLCNKHTGSCIILKDTEC
ncbi:hypothetical protein [Pseudomonas putida]